MTVAAVVGIVLTVLAVIGGGILALGALAAIVISAWSH